MKSAGTEFSRSTALLEIIKTMPGGEQKDQLLDRISELDVIAAAVLGGTSLFGGRGSAVGSVLGAVLVETVRNGLNIVDADPYIYPVITGATIFVAVLLDSARHARLAKMRRRNIRTETAVA